MDKLLSIIYRCLDSCSADISRFSCGLSYLLLLLNWATSHLEFSHIEAFACQTSFSFSARFHCAQPSAIVDSSIYFMACREMWKCNGKRWRKQMSVKFTSLNRYFSSVIVVALSLTVSFVRLKSKRHSGDYTWHCFKPSTVQQLNVWVSGNVSGFLVVDLKSFAFQFSAYQTIRQKVVHKIKDLCTYFA